MAGGTPRPRIGQSRRGFPATGRNASSPLSARAVWNSAPSGNACRHACWRCVPNWRRACSRSREARREPVPQSASGKRHCGGGAGHRRCQRRSRSLYSGSSRRARHARIGAGRKGGPGERRRGGGVRRSAPRGRGPDAEMPRRPDRHAGIVGVADPSLPGAVGSNLQRRTCPEWNRSCKLTGGNWSNATPGLKADIRQLQKEDSRAWHDLAGGFHQAWRSLRETPDGLRDCQ